MQDIIKHKRPHTADNCRACRTYTKGEKLKATRRRTLALIQDMWADIQGCSHPITYITMRPDIMDENGDYSDGSKLKMCRNCWHVLEIVR